MNSSEEMIVFTHNESDYEIQMAGDFFALECKITGSGKAAYVALRHEYADRSNAGCE
jgi:hypothetical protein